MKIQLQNAITFAMVRKKSKPMSQIRFFFCVSIRGIMTELANCLIHSKLKPVFRFNSGRSGRRIINFRIRKTFSRGGKCFSIGKVAKSSSTSSTNAPKSESKTSGLVTENHWFTHRKPAVYISKINDFKKLLQFQLLLQPDDFVAILGGLQEVQVLGSFFHQLRRVGNALL